jgi:hypothetical protein
VPEFERHCLQASHNEKVLDFLNNESKAFEFSDWYVTIDFYCALHYIEAIIYKLKNFKISKSNKLSFTGEHSLDFKHALDTNSD